MTTKDLLDLLSKRRITPVEISKQTKWKQGGICTTLERMRFYGLVKREKIRNNYTKGRNTHIYTITDRGRARLLWYAQNNKKDG